jgi:Uma2 family endonuclease
MSTMTSPAIAPAVQPEWTPSPDSLYRMSVAKYEAMVASGVFTKRDRFHLIYGFLVAKMTEYPPHAACCDGIRLAIEPLLPPGWYVRLDKPLKIPDRASVPEPDAVLTRGTWRDYEQRHPEPQDVSLVVEVSSSSLSDDRKLARLYAEAGIPSYWIVNLIDRQVEVYTDPAPSGYRTSRVFRPEEHVPLMLEGRELGQILVADILPRDASTS